MAELRAADLIRILPSRSKSINTELLFAEIAIQMGPMLLNSVLH